MTHIISAPWETFAEHDDRSKLESPYNETFIAKCRTKALEYDKEDVFLRGSLLSSLQPAVPMHYRGKVFEGISFIFVK